MKVKELLQTLQEYDGVRDCCINSCADGEYSNIAVSHEDGEDAVYLLPYTSGTCELKELINDLSNVPQEADVFYYDEKNAPCGFEVARRKFDAFSCGMRLERGFYCEHCNRECCGEYDPEDNLPDIVYSYWAIVFEV